MFLQAVNIIPHVNSHNDHILLVADFKKYQNN
jgi:hypothetical protein